MECCEKSPEINALCQPIAEKHGYVNCRSDDEKEILFKAVYPGGYYWVKLVIHFVDSAFAGVHAKVSYDPNKVEVEDIPRKEKYMGVNILVPYDHLQTFIEILAPNMIESAKL